MMLQTNHLWEKKVEFYKSIQSGSQAILTLRFQFRTGASSQNDIGPVGLFTKI
jgi:hypothetical protein